MKAIVENPVPNPCLYALFITIINDITTSYTEEQLRKNMRSTMSIYDRLSEYVDYGFGHNHMWISDRKTGKRLIFVEF